MTSAKEAIEDYKRSMADQQINTRKATVITGGSPQEVMWQNIVVGDIIKLKADDGVPADCVVISTSELNAVCYIETANLDGETNLKVRSAPEKVYKHCSTVETVGKLHMNVTAETRAPTYFFTENYFSRDCADLTSTLPLSLQKNFLPRGSFVRNTEELYAIIVYTGPDTKLVMNSRAAPSKRSNLEKRVDVYISFIFAILFGLTAISSIMRSMFHNHFSKMAEETIIQTSSVNAPVYNYTFDATNITGHAYDGIHSYVCQTNTSRLGKYEVKGKEVDFRPFPELKEYLNSCKKYLCPVWCWTPDPYHASDSDSACTGFVHQMCEYTTDGDPRIDCNAWFDDSVEKESIIETAVAYLILYNLVPISLYLTMELVKWWQARNMEADKDMYHAKRDTAMASRTSEPERRPRSDRVHILGQDGNAHMQRKWF